MAAGGAEASSAWLVGGRLSRTQAAMGAGRGAGQHVGEGRLLGERGEVRAQARVKARRGAAVGVGGHALSAAAAAAAAAESGYKYVGRRAVARGWPAREAAGCRRAAGGGARSEV